MAAFHRKLREGALTETEYQRLLARLFADEKAGGFLWHPLTKAVLRRLEKAWTSLPHTVYLHSADAIHLATAAENGHEVVYSNDRHFLAAAPALGLAGVNPLAP
jgi:predicted nucleic acid-binding protein